MKQTIHTFAHAAIIACGAFAISAFPVSVNAASDRTDNLTFSTVINPEVPSSITFCGKKIDLDRNDMYERFDRELTGQAYTHGSTLLMIKRANKYFPIIAPILKAQGVPADLIYLACAESSLNPRAYSSAKAAGIWQFLAGTAKQYGLEVNDEIDERYHVEKATVAACKFLKSALAKYGDWPTAMASYNAGMGRISGELDKQLVDNSFDLLLNDETSRYVFRIMAIKTLLENPSAYGFHLSADQLYRNADCDIIKVTGPVEDWAIWANDHGITYAQLKEENPWIRGRSLTNKTGKTYEVKVPTKASLYRSGRSTDVYNKAWIR